MDVKRTCLWRSRALAWARPGVHRAIRPAPARFARLAERRQDQRSESHASGRRRPVNDLKAVEEGQASEASRRGTENVVRYGNRERALSDTSNHLRHANMQRFQRPVHTPTPTAALGAGVSAAPIAAPRMKASPAPASKCRQRCGLPTCLVLIKTVACFSRASSMPLTANGPDSDRWQGQFQGQFWGQSASRNLRCRLYLGFSQR